MVMVLEAQIVESIAQIGRLRRPAEACGLLLPVPVKGRQIIEIPNRAKQAHDTFEMAGTDMIMELEKIMSWEQIEELLEKKAITAWHTHPSGNVGPSKFDMDYKPPKMMSLVVTLFEDGRVPLATWF